MTPRRALLGLLLFSTLLLHPAAAAPQQRHHAILINGDDWAMETDDAGRPKLGADGAFAYQTLTIGELRATDKGLAVARPGASAAARPSPTTGATRLAPLAWTRRDVERFEHILLAFAHPGLVTTLTSDHQGATVAATARSPHRGANTVAQVRRAFQDTACRIADLHGQAMTDCAGVEVPPEVRTRGSGAVEDVVWVFFSGHGTPHDIVLRNGFLPGGDLEELVAGLGAGLAVVMIDACHGAGQGQDPPPPHALLAFRRGPMRGPTDIAVFNAARPYTVPEVGALRSGLLTHVLASGLLGGADDDDDGLLRFEELAAFFQTQTTGAAELDGRAQAPGGNRRRVLLRFDRPRLAEQTLDVDRDLGGRLLVADATGAVAELNVQRRHIYNSRTVPLRLPLISDPQRYSVYYLPLREDGGTLSGVRVAEDWDPVHQPRSLHSFEGSPAADEDPLAGYLAMTQRERRLFSRQGVPLSTWSMGRQLVTSATVGFHPVPAYGRLEKDYAKGTVEAYLQAQEPAFWNLSSLDLAARAHGLLLFHAELRSELEWTPSTRVEGQDAGLFLGRGLGGLGVSGFLGSRALEAAATVGGGPMLIGAYGTTQSGLESVYDSSPPWALYGALTLHTRLPRIRPLVLEGVFYQDHISVYGDRVRDGTTGEWPAHGAAEDRTYSSWRVALGFDLGRWPR